MNRLLYFTGYRMVAQEWSGSDLQNSVYFEPDEQGYDLFKTYLTSIKKEPIRLLVDLIEEEFRTNTVPAVHGPDRSALIKRNLEKFFRHTRFRYATRQSVRKNKNRKEESLLFTGITNPDLLEPWLDILKSTKTPLTGILSLPIISEKFVTQFDNKNKCVVLVSQQVPSNLRQTVFVDGKLVLSRLVPIASFYQGDYAKDVIRDVDSTNRYLISQRLIDRSDKVSVHILANRRHIDKLTVACAESSYFDYEIHNINELLKNKKIDLYDEQDFSSTLFCYEASKLKFENHYADSQDKRYFSHYIVGLGLKIAGITLFTIGLGLGVSSTIQGYLYKQSITEIDAIKIQYDIQGKRLAEKTKSLPAPTKDMKFAVNISEVFEKNYKNSPKELMSNVSQDLLLFADLRASNIKWFITNDITDVEANSVIWSGKKRRKRGAKRQKAFNGHYEVLILSGEFLKFSGNYRYALSVLSDFEDLMKESGKYDQIEILQSPLNVDGQASLSGAALDTKDSSKNKAVFKIKIVKKVAFNA